MKATKLTITCAAISMLGLTSSAKAEDYAIADTGNSQWTVHSETAYVTKNPKGQKQVNAMITFYDAETKESERAIFGVTGCGLVGGYVGEYTDTTSKTPTSTLMWAARGKQIVDNLARHICSLASGKPASVKPAAQRSEFIL